MRAVDIRHHQHHLPVHWIKPGQIYSGNLERRLHSEILDFVEFMEATKEELASRAKVVERFQSAIQKVTPKATLGVFGSFATGLVLAHSDIDLVILDQSKSTVSQPRAPATELKKYRNKIAEQCSGFCPILKAKVPIFNCRDYLTGFKLDISFNQANGIATVPVIQGLMTELPALRPLVMVLKQFLHCRGLDVGANGSVGGYGLTCWVAGFLRIHPDVFASRYKAVPLGILLTDFLLLFGFSFDYLKLGLAPGDSGGSWIFSKREGLGFEQGRPSEKLYIRDPQNEHSNVTASLAKIGVVTEHLAAAYDQL
ncbi:uncharacterized protein EV422DRAFT_501867, partial [Fimicolochytrium jonesii]|uniref:uncharacterized protein n=1 Tax=Fimicolochytrium jonesii TaxID=1396493 RepID=UPI0022FDC2CC